MAAPEVDHQLAGWALYWARLARPVDAADRLEETVTAEPARLAAALGNRPLATVEPAPSIRALFRAAGADPTRYRPSSEALARRLLRGDAFPRRLPLVDLNNLLSLRTLLPCCVMRAEVPAPPFVLRRGDDESMESLRGPFALAGKPLLADEAGPFSTPITDARRVGVEAETETALLVVYAPARLAGDATIEACLAELASAASATVSDTGWTGT